MTENNNELSPAQKAALNRDAKLAEVRLKKALTNAKTTVNKFITDTFPEDFKKTEDFKKATLDIRGDDAKILDFAKILTDAPTISYKAIQLETLLKYDAVNGDASIRTATKALIQDMNDNNWSAELNADKVADLQNIFNGFVNEETRLANEAKAQKAAEELADAKDTVDAFIKTLPVTAQEKANLDLKADDATTIAFAKTLPVDVTTISYKAIQLATLLKYDAVNGNSSVRSATKALIQDMNDNNWSAELNADKVADLQNIFNGFVNEETRLANEAKAQKAAEELADAKDTVDAFIKTLPVTAQEKANLDLKADDATTIAFAKTLPVDVTTISYKAIQLATLLKYDAVNGNSSVRSATKALIQDMNDNNWSAELNADKVADLQNIFNGFVNEETRLADEAKAQKAAEELADAKGSVNLFMETTFPEDFRKTTAFKELTKDIWANSDQIIRFAKDIGSPSTQTYITAQLNYIVGDDRCTDFPSIRPITSSLINKMNADSKLENTTWTVNLVQGFNELYEILSPLPTAKCLALNEALNDLVGVSILKQINKTLDKKGYSKCVTSSEDATCESDNACYVQLEDALEINGETSNFFCCE